MKHRAPPPAGVLSKAKRYPVRFVGAIFAVLLLLCFCGNALGEFLGDDKPTATPSVSASAAPIAAVPSNSVPASPSPTPSRTAKPTPKPTRSPQSTVKRTTHPSMRNGVHPGGSCKAAGAVGRTSTGKLMVCKRSAGDNRLRWRPA
ncbi:hypothetical protein GA0070624_3729 [Micromonospora rhizosphaerae]|uniref:Uncharacterized protein n=1 Tax=Micromonospora rhizosphaerae TaxID=568872 RepID=A0A1C6SHB0_9ACTN|nr:hypothetical protein GA0070624_3729 [Micromonospora rhizosphaerae]